MTSPRTSNFRERSNIFLSRLSPQRYRCGVEPVNNTLWGLNLNWKHESQWLTNMLDKLPLLHLTQPSQISFTGEFAQLIAGQSHGTQDNASYLDDFENTTDKIDVSTPYNWQLSSVPSMFPEHTDNATLRSGFNRSLLAWYTIDPLFTRLSSSLTPGHIKSDLNQAQRPLRARSLHQGALSQPRPKHLQRATSTISVLNLAYYPNERATLTTSTPTSPPTVHSTTPHATGAV